MDAPKHSYLIFPLLDNPTGKILELVNPDNLLVEAQVTLGLITYGDRVPKAGEILHITHDFHLIGSYTYSRPQSWKLFPVDTTNAGTQIL